MFELLGHDEVVQFLVNEAKADINISNILGLTPLLLAVKHGISI